MTTPRIIRISGALAEASPMQDAGLYQLAAVGERHLLGEIVRVEGDRATLQVYEDTIGLATGEAVVPTGSALTASLGPGLLGSILDGLGRPLNRIAERHGPFIGPGTQAPTLDPAATWNFRASMKPGDAVQGGDILGTVLERGRTEHRIMVPPGVAGLIETIESGNYSVADPVGRLKDGTPLGLSHAWPVRMPRPIGERLRDSQPFVTGQRVLDFLFPAAQGATVAIPGGFGTGKTIIEHSLAKYAEADIVVYVGCGERGNEMAEVLHDFPALIDGRTGRSIMDRTVMVVNTSNMPVAAREASVYLGVTIAEYYRDMGYHVALLVDSLSRWAEALRELGGRLAEMPGEEGYPTYLASRMGQFYERAGRVRALGNTEREGSVTIIAAVSPPGGDLSEPVTQATLRVAGTLWALDATLAHQRQFPAVDWGTSYSLHAGDLIPRLAEATGPDWGSLRSEAMSLLQQGRNLREIAGLVGPEALQDQDRLVLEIARTLQEVLLGQSAFDPHDARSPLLKTYRVASLVLAAFRAGCAALGRGARFDQVDLAGVRRGLGELLRVAPEEFDASAGRLEKQIGRLAGAEPGA